MTAAISPPVLINTRPTARAASLSAYLRARAVEVAEIPMLTLTPCSITAEEHGYLAQWQAGVYQALVVISPTAAAYGLAALRERSAEAPCQAHVIAVGKRTYTVLQQADMLPTDTLTMPAISSNEGLIAMPEIAQLSAGARVLIWRGHGGRRLLVEHLHARGIQVDSIAWYARTMPTSAQAHYRAWQAQYVARHGSKAATRAPWVLISSGAAFEHWVHTLSHNVPTQTDAPVFGQRLTDFRYIVLGTRLTQLLTEQQLVCVTVEALDPPLIYDAMQQTTA
ncbi:uroporphyrinogen-III synthase [Psychrobacter aestuarii]|uniref:Uroporphyrinogen-III synthase n=1 Tax=Psychrobacter aestuarii TaxID=556327 RepID=A0ABP3FSW0_9GAMM|nr:uroporphyrinogen-III synthase [Psychrobacter aestuarii]